MNLEEFEERLKQQQSAFAVTHDIGRAISSSRDLKSLYTSISLGLKEMLHFKQQVFFEISAETFTLVPVRSLGCDESKLFELEFGLDFFSGAYTDALFCNQHIIVDDIGEDDVVHHLGIAQYAAFPLVSRTFDERGDIITCGNPECPCAQATTPYWWSDFSNYAKDKELSEDEYRKACCSCPEFKCLGVMILGLDSRDMITSEEVSVITGLMYQTAMILEAFNSQQKLREANEKLRLTNVALKEANKVIQKELTSAHAIQKKLLPKEFPMDLVLDVSSHYESTNRVGGDYYDCFELAPGKLAIVIADVSGHGVSAALIMSMFKVLLKTKSRTFSKPAETIESINRAFVEEVQSDHFVTLFYGIFDQSSRVLTYTSSGHDPVILLDKDNSIKKLTSTQAIIGAFGDLTCVDNQIELEEESRLVLFTDGIVEAKNSAGSMYTLERLMEMTYLYANKNCSDFLELLLKDHFEFTSGLSLKDDITLLILDL
ncbi:MAG: PP2C family protein-serine/threonine phosphatase [Fibrobacterales bacterium]